MKKIKNAILLFPFILIACHSGINKNILPVAKDTALIKRADTVADSMIGDEAIDEMSDTTIIPKKIGYNLYAFPNIFLKEPFSRDSALKKLYPGNYYKFRIHENDLVIFEAWSSKASSMHKFKGWCYAEDTDEIFPCSDSNETQIGDTLLFTDNAGKRNIIISFGTTPFEEDFIGMGRCDGIFMGLAMFTEENHKWQLKAFNPAIGYYGMFQQIPNIHLFKFNKENIGCYIGNMEQSGGGPDYIDAYFFGVFDHTFKIILEKYSVCRGNRDHNQWNADMEIDSAQISKHFPDLIFTITGDYLSSGFEKDDGEDTSVTLAAIKPIIKRKDNFDFVITNRYTFSGCHYDFVKESVITYPHKENEDKKQGKYHW